MTFLSLVLLLCGGLYIRIWIVSKLKRKMLKSLENIAKAYACLPPPRIENHRPLGLDRLEQILRANNESRLMELLHHHLHRTGYTLQQVFLGTSAFGTIDPENLEVILSTNFSRWSIKPRREITLPLFGDGIFTQEGDHWRHSRDLLRPQFSCRQYEDLRIFDEPIKDLLELLPSSGGMVDLQPLFFRFTLDVSTEYLFGKSVQSLKGEYSAVFEKSFDCAQKYVANRFRLQSLYWLIDGREFREACRQVHAFADHILDLALDEDSTVPRENPNFVFLRTAAKVYPDRAVLRGHVINLLAAGRDTTACLLTWTWYLLVRHPLVLEKLRHAIVATGIGDNINRTQLRGFEYLQNILKETLRLYPPVPVNARTAVNTTILPTGGGPDRSSPVLIAAGTTVAYSAYALHRRPDLYGMDAECFRPERWEEDLPLYENSTTRAYGYLPFSSGPRVCMGIDFAVTEAAYTTVRLLQCYRSISLPRDEPIELLGVERQSMTLVLQSGHGCKVDLAQKVE